MTSEGKERPIIVLEDTVLWNTFNNNLNEMILTKKGRRMFPTIKIKVSGLNPEAQYVFSLEFLPVDNYRYKYSTTTGWTSSENEDKSNMNNKLCYSHPNNVTLGSKWMSQTVAFGGLKLTNNSKPCANNIILTSMHKYQPRIILRKYDKFKNVVCSIHKIFVETSFIAVTAYQNNKITDLKINNNPFAKGFRQRATKRKRVERTNSWEDDENSNVDVDDQKNEKAFTDQRVSFSIDNILAWTNNRSSSCCCPTYNRRSNFLNSGHFCQRAREHPHQPPRPMSDYSVEAILKWQH